MRNVVQYDRLIRNKVNLEVNYRIIKGYDFLSIGF